MPLSLPARRGRCSRRRPLIKRIRGTAGRRWPRGPTANGKMVLIDCGATAEGTPEYLMQFAYMGSYYAQRFLGVENPRVALLNIGAEESKGLELQKQTYALLTEAKQAGRIHFVGNIEGREAITQGVDVLVTDGYTGNIFLKTMEGAAALFSGALKEMLLASTKNKVAALMLKNSIGDFKKRFDSSEVGGHGPAGHLPAGGEGPRLLQRLCLLQRHPSGQDRGRGGYCGRHRRQRGTHALGAAQACGEQREG